MKLNKIFKKRKKTIQTRILFPFLLLIIIAGGIIAFVSYTYSVKNTTNELTKNVESQVGGLNDTFTLFFENIDSSLTRLTSNELITHYQKDNSDALFQYLKETADSNDYIKSLYTGFDETGNVVIYPKADLSEDFNAKERPWYQKAVEAKNSTIWTEPYVDEATNETVVTAAKAYYRNDELQGVVGIDLSINSLLEMLNKTKIGDTGYAVLFDQSGSFLAHPDKSYIGKDQSNRNYYQKITESGKQGTFDYQSEGQNKIMGFAKNDTTGWVIGGTVNKAEFENKAKGILIPISITLVVVLALAVIISLITTRKITKPIFVVLERMKSIANGDLSQEPLQTKSNDEVGQLVSATNTMNNSMRDLLQQINDVSETVSNQSEELNKSANEVMQGSEQIASTMQEISSGTESQANNASELSSNAQTFTENVQEANSKGELIYQKSHNVLQLTDKGSQLMNTSVNQMDFIDQMVQDTVKKVKELDEQSKDISKLVNVIEDIADQTSLLAINAAIEAARAGEQGKGFAVVADSVKNLAEQVANSVSDITGIVENIQKETNTVVNALENGYSEVEKGTEQVQTTGETFDQINSAVQQMANDIETVTQYLSTMSSTSQEMSGSIDEIASASEEASAGIEQTSASTQQTNSSMEEVASSSEELAKLAERLNGLVRKFSL
ncbi:methyl-accepting chemotaxis protein [Salinibacillus kushneri]|uniref:Methyl-accepting chemotaxis protein n=1 Tax=Salinibacillus kushneri TaxID=237682 RepID=A0A1I0HBE7_9BACI|nr:methyl-accepting chemotaxis protein [Salinibacillus kushneri]SET81164.1 methyl-accepting chemotaxis protein [Salinibacillus kushneri]